MFKKLCFVLFLVAVFIRNSVQAAAVSADLYNSEDRISILERLIMDGTVAKKYSIPYQISMRNYSSNSYLCGGSIIAPRVLMTAAHCVSSIQDPRTLLVYVGTDKLNSGGTPHKIRKIVAHEHYERACLLNDIAIMFTEKEIQFGAAADAVELNDEPVEEGEELLLSGWGATSLGGVNPNDLMTLTVSATSYEECGEAHYPTYPVYESMICTLTIEGRGACTGDSGGPLVRLYDKEPRRQVGIVSWGVPCAKGKPDVYTKVEAFIDWIEKTLLNDDPEHLKYIEYKRQLGLYNRQNTDY